MRTRKQLIVTLLLVFLAVILSTIFRFLPAIDNLFLLFFVLLGYWFSYVNYKKKEQLMYTKQHHTAFNYFDFLNRNFI